MCRTSFVSCISIQLLLLLYNSFFLLQLDSSFIWVLWSLPFACIMFEDYFGVAHSSRVLRTTIIFTFILFTYSMGRENNALKMDCAICFLVFLFSFIGYYIRKVRIRKWKNLFGAAQFNRCLLNWQREKQNIARGKKIREWYFVRFFSDFINLRSLSIKNRKQAHLRSRNEKKVLQKKNFPNLSTYANSHRFQSTEMILPTKLYIKSKKSYGFCVIR